MTVSAPVPPPADGVGLVPSTALGRQALAPRSLPPASLPERHLRPAGLLVGALALAYPFAVYAGLAAGHVRATAVGVAAALGVIVARRLAALRGARIVDGRGRGRARALGPLLVAPATGLALGALAAATGDGRLVLALPVLVNAALLAVFAGSLRGESTIERLARVVDPALPPGHARYCRKVTIAWCATFAASGAVAAALALRGQLEAWALWTGLLAHLLVLAVALGELAARRARFGDRAPGLVATVRAFVSHGR